MSLLSLFPTLLELSGLPARSEHDGPSLLPLLTDPKAEWPHAAITYLADPGSYSVSHEDWRLIHYANGEEELYEIRRDPFEWTNLANDADRDAKTAAILDSKRIELRKFAPREFANKPEVTLEALVQLQWQSVDDQDVPPSQPDGGPFDVFFINKRPQPLKLYWMSREGVPKFYAELKQDQPHRQQTRPGAVWAIQNQEGETEGYFRIDDRSAKAIIPR